MPQSFDFLGSAKTVAIVCNQWGDTGKGKFVDYLTAWADIVARGTGGANAGHTIVRDGKTYIFHLLPSSILHDLEGKISVIGNGVAFDPRQCLEELGMLHRDGFYSNHLFISHHAKLVMPYHLLMDRLKDSSMADGKIGTTGRGIGPVYTDFYARTGLCVNDLLNKDTFAKKLKKNLEEKRVLWERFDMERIKEVLQHPHLEHGKFFDAHHILNHEAIVETYTQDYGNTLRPYIVDTEFFLQKYARRKNILLEGAQGYLLSVDYGSHPFVTSSDSSIQGLAKGVGLSVSDIDLTLGVMKGFYMTRVGAGPFPTELGGDSSEHHCATETKNSEQARFSTADINNPDALTQGIAIRFAGAEYGATTGRPRRIGWLDLPLLRQAIKINGSQLILTKLDVLDTINEIKICIQYQYIGPAYTYGSTTVHWGDTFTEAPQDSFILRHCQPLYQTFHGWKCSTSHVTEYAALPSTLRHIVDFVEHATQSTVVLLSVGPQPEQTIIKTTNSFEAMAGLLPLPNRIRAGLTTEVN